MLRYPTLTDWSWKLSRTSTSMTWSGMPVRTCVRVQRMMARARCAPPQRCWPSPNPTRRLGHRVMSSSSALGNSFSSRLAEAAGDQQVDDAEDLVVGEVSPAQRAIGPDRIAGVL
jgi:hypothetical protein